MKHGPAARCSGLLGGGRLGEPGFGFLERSKRTHLSGAVLGEDLCHSSHPEGSVAWDYNSTSEPAETLAQPAEECGYGFDQVCRRGDIKLRVIAQEAQTSVKVGVREQSLDRLRNLLEVQGVRYCNSNE